MTARARIGYGGWAVTKLREAGGEETRRFEAVLTHHGRPRIHVSNGGEGGENRYQPLASGAEGQEALSALEAWAADWNATGPYAGYGDVDVFVDRLVEVAVLNRMRKILFVLDDACYWCGDDARTVVGLPDRGEALVYLRHQYPDRNVRVWSRNASDWVPLDCPPPPSRQGPLATHPPVSSRTPRHQPVTGRSCVPRPGEPVHNLPGPSGDVG